jgi:hypothetical protein
MNTIKINYNYDTDKTEIEFSDEFNSLPLSVQHDAMQEGLVLLMRRYNRLLEYIDERWDDFQRLNEQKRDRAKKRYANDERDDNNGI